MSFRNLENKLNPVGVEYYEAGKILQAIVVRSHAEVDGINFVTGQEASFQLGLMGRKSGYVVPHHVHSRQERLITDTQEFLLIRKGSCEVSLFDRESIVNHKIKLNAGDAILLIAGGHSICMLEDTHILEIKQGPYFSALDKVIIHDSRK